MDPNNDTANSSRLSLDVANLPLTPFGMSQRGSNRKRNHAGSPGGTKLSLKNKVKSPPIQNKENSPRPMQIDGRQRQVFPKPSSLGSVSRIGRRRGHFPLENQTNLDPVLEVDDVSEIDDITTRERPGDFCDSVKSVSVSVITNHPQSTKSSVEDPVRKRDSIFTDVDDGSFIEFYSREPTPPVQIVREPNPPVQIVRENRMGPPQLYYTCDTHRDDSVFSTSTKTKGAIVGFRRFVDKMKWEREGIFHQNVQMNTDDSVVHAELPPKFLMDETIIAGSRDIVINQPIKVAKKNAVNSTMVDPADFQDHQPFNIPDISTLTLQANRPSGTNSQNSTPTASPNYAKSNKNLQRKVIVQSSDSEDSIICVGVEDGKVLKPKPSKGKGSEPLGTLAAKVNNVCSNPSAVVYPERGKAKAHVEKEVFVMPDGGSSLISEDVSVIDSSNYTGLPNQNPLREGNRVVAPNNRICSSSQRIGFNDQSRDYNVEGRVSVASPVQRPSSPPKIKSPIDVATWVLTSPFKEGSQDGLSFLLGNDTLDISDTPSQPKFKVVAHSSGTVENPKSPSKNRSPRFYCVKEKSPSKNLPDTNNIVNQVPELSVPNVASSGKQIYINTEVEGPAVEKWIMTSPFDEGSYGSSFLRHRESPDVGQNPSQRKPRQSPADSGGSCEKSLFVRLAHQIQSCSRSLLPTFQKRVDGDESSHSSKNSDEVVRRRKSRISEEQKVISESDVSKHLGGILENRYKNVTLERRKNRTQISDSTRLFSEESESLHLELTGAFTRSLKDSEGSHYTVGKDAASPQSNSEASVIGESESPQSHSEASVVGESDSDSCLKKSATGPRNRLRIPESDEDEGSVLASQPAVKSSDKVRILASDEDDESSDSPIKPVVRSGIRTKVLDSDDDHEESDKSLPDVSQALKTPGNLVEVAERQEFSHENLRSKVDNIPDTKKTNQEKKIRRSSSDFPQRPKRSTRKPSEYFTSDDDSSSDLDQEQDIKTKNDDDRGLAKPNVRVKISHDLTNGSLMSEDDSESSFEIYLKSVKKQIVQESAKKSKGPLNDMGSFIVDSDDDSEDGASFYLPSLSQRLMGGIRTNNKPDWKSLGSVSDDLQTRVKKRSEGSITKKKLKEPKFVTTSPITGIRSLPVKKSVSNPKSWRNSLVVDISSDSDSDVFPEPVSSKKPNLPLITPKNKNPPKGKAKTEGRPKSTQVQRKLECGGANTASPTLTFLASLSSTVHAVRCHPDAALYVQKFKKKKGELCDKLYSYYNEHIFSEKLPPSMNIKWNPRLTKTAGFCYYQIDRSKPNGRGARIELSNKVIDVPERLRDTLIHEMCHAAAWIISGYKDGHGPLWKSWAARARSVFPELPAITTCHSYQITCKYTYKCSGCNYSIGRHSKSLDTERKVCGYCYGKFELIVNSQRKGSSNSTSMTPQSSMKTPRTPGAFALFVKENYHSVKKSKQNLKHADVMKALSTEFAKMKTASN